MSGLTLTPLFWEDGALVPTTPLEPLDDAATGAFTILHTNDLHASIDARPEHGRGGLARITSTVDAQRTHGPTLVVDAGDSVFGGGTWWCAQDARPTSRLLSVVGYDLAAIGNHDIERGPRSLWELLEAGRRLVSTNLRFDDVALQQKIPPAYVAQLGGLRVGVLGLTTAMTTMLVPSATLRGINYLDTPESARDAATALAPLVHTIVVLSHLGFDNDFDSDVHIIPSLQGTKVAAILGGHTHEALDPSPVIGGIITCNAGAHGVNVNRVSVARDAHGSVSIRAKLLPQDHSVPESSRFLAAREHELESFRPLQDSRAPLPPLVGPHSGGRRDREVGLLRTALQASHASSPDAIQMVPHLYMVGELPAGGSVSQLDVLTVYPNAERLVEIELTGAALKQVLALQAGLAFFYSAVPVWLESGAQVSENDLQEGRTYLVVTTPLAAEGGLNWHAMRTQRPTVRPLGSTCAELVWSYLRTRASRESVGN